MQKLKDCKTIEELAKEFKANFSKVTNKDEFTALKDEMKAKFEIDFEIAKNNYGYEEATQCD